MASSNSRVKHESSVQLTAGKITNGLSKLQFKELPAFFMYIMYLILSHAQPAIFEHIHIEFLYRNEYSLFTRCLVYAILLKYFSFQLIKIWKVFN